MVFCIAGLLIFAILGVFSTKYRRYFRESIHCMRRQLLLKPCDTQFDQEMKAKITANISKTSPKLARFVFKRFAFLSWILLILMLFSTAAVAFGAYNYIAYGNCNGPYSSDFCVFGALDGSFDERVKDIKPIEAFGPTLGNPDASVEIIEVGCYACPYTKDAEGFRNQLLDKYGDNVSFTFMAMPLEHHGLSWETAEAAYCAEEQKKYWEYHDLLFENQDSITIEKIKELAEELELDMNRFNECLDDHIFRDAVKQIRDKAVEANIFATPTYFVNGRPFVGIKAFADFEQIVGVEIRGSCA